MPSLIPEPGSWFDRIMTFVLANVLWFLLALPVITLPAATAGLFATLAPLVRGRDGELFATFFGTMRRQWLKSTLILVADAAIALLLALNFTLLSQMPLPAPVFWLFRGLYIFLAISALMINLYLWPLLVLFDFPLRRLFRVSAALAFAHPVWSLFTLGLALLPLALALFVPLLFSALLVFSTIVLIINWGAWRIIEKYVSPEDLAGLDHV